MTSKSHRRDRDGREGDRSSRHGSSYGRDGSRDGRERETREPSWREADARQYDVRDSRPGSAAGIAHNTPPKPIRGAATASAVRAGPLGSSAISNAIMEAAKRRAQEQQAAAADSEEEGETGAARKRARHEPIVWHSPSRAADAAAADAKPQESLQERLQREAAEFKQRHNDAGPADSTSHKHRRSSHHHQVRGRSPSSSEEEHEHAAAAVRHGTHKARRQHSRSSSRSRSSQEEGQQGKSKKAGGRWAAEEQADDGPGQTAAAARDSTAEDEQLPLKSRWFADEEDEGQTPAVAEEGEAPGAAIDEELEELNRRERAELEAGEASGSGSEAAAAAPPAGAVDSDDDEDTTFTKNLLEESRRVEEYERLNRISEGTYGVVHRARCKATGEIFALKKLKLEACADGFPQTSIREMNVLLSLNHPNIVKVPEIVIGSRDAVYMVMEYVEHDLKYVLELQKSKKAQPFSIGQIKCLLKQLLAGVAYLHEHWVIHRDLKTSNLLYSNNGELKICDFGLARQYGSPLRAFTPQVVTLWYRSIDRLLGDPLYSTALDLWSVGCIMGELILGEPLFQGRGELDQIKRIFALLGTPTEEDWPGWDNLPDSKNLQWKPQESQLRKKFPQAVFNSTQPSLSETGFQLLSRLLDMNPRTRITAAEALEHPWFTEAPRAVNAALMPVFPQRHQGRDGGFRDKLGNPSPGAVGPVAGFGL